MIISGSTVQSRLSQFLTMLKLVDKELFKIIESYKFTESDIVKEPVILELFRKILGILCLRREHTSLEHGKMPEVEEFMLFFPMSPKQKEFYDTLKDKNADYQVLRRAASSMAIKVPEAIGVDNPELEKKTSKASAKWNGL